MNVRIILALFLAFTAPPTFANDLSDLRTGCGEAISIYNKRGEERFLAAQTTSASEALRAGYCRGVVREYLRTARPCLYGRNAVDDWRGMAARLAKAETGQAGSFEEMLRSARCGY